MRKEYDPARLSWIQGNSDRNLSRHSQGRRTFRKKEGVIMLDLKYSLVIEATEDPNFFGFYSPDLEGFTGVGHSVEDCLYQARWGTEEYLNLCKEENIPVPSHNPIPVVTIQNSPRESSALPV